MRYDEARTVRPNARVTTMFGDTGRVTEVEDTGRDIRFHLTEIVDRNGLPISGTMRVPARYALPVAIDVEVVRPVARAD